MMIFILMIINSKKVIIINKDLNQIIYIQYLIIFEESLIIKSILALFNSKKEIIITYFIFVKNLVFKIWSKNIKTLKFDNIILKIQIIVIIIFFNNLLY